MTKSKYEQERDANIQKIQDVFKSLGIAVLAETISSVLSKEEPEQGKTLEEEKPESDNDYSPTSDIDNLSDSDDDYDYQDDLTTEVRPMAPGSRHPKKKENMAPMPATPIRLTRASSTKLQSPPRYTRATAPLISSIANAAATKGGNQQRARANLSTSNQVPATQNTTTNTTNTMATPANSMNTMATPANSMNTMPNPTSPARLTRSTANLLQQTTPTSPTRLTRSTASLLQQPTPSPTRLTRSTASLLQQPTPTTGRVPSTAVDNSPGGQSSRQSNQINELSGNFDTANCSDGQINGEADEDLVVVPPRNVRKKTMGHGLERMIKRGNKMPIQVAEGKLRPDVPVQAAKLASECGVALRDNLPIYTSWKQYKNIEGEEEVSKVLRKVASRLDVDVRNDGPSKAACTNIIKKGVKQQRYLIKRKYFDESLTREQLLAKELPPNMNKQEWTKLVDYWCDPKVKEHCAINKENRSLVRLHQKTGARSYVAHRYSLRAKYNNREPDPVEFFGECMTSPRNGRTGLANQIYEDMVAEKEREPEEGEAQKSPTQIVADSLSQISPASTFLPNMGVTPVSKPSRSTSATEARLRSQFEATIEAQREEAARKQEQLEAQIEAQQATIQANQAALEQNQSLLRQTQEDVKGMQTKFEETNALLRAMLNLQNSSCR